MSNKRELPNIQEMKEVILNSGTYTGTIGRKQLKKTIKWLENKGFKFAYETIIMSLFLFISQMNKKPAPASKKPDNIVPGDSIG